ncbi:unnamed protein product [Cochlearia groenlandica]
MEVSGVVLRQIPCFSRSVVDVRYSDLRSVSNFSGDSMTARIRTRRVRGIMCSNEFSDKAHMSYYLDPARCGGDGGGEKEKKVKGMEKEKEKKAMKKKAKILKSLSKNLNMFSSIGFGLDSESGLVAEIQNKTISEATEILVKQIDQLKTEEKLMKKQKKEEKAKAKALKMITDMDSESSSSSSSESSDSDCDKRKVIDMSSLRNNTKPVLEEPVKSEPTQSFKKTGEALLQAAASIRVKTVEAVESPLKKRVVEVCMGGKCKKSGGVLLLDEFQKAMNVVEGGSAVACKCMGKCRDGPNVRVVDGANDVLVVDSVRTPSKTVCVGVGVEDVETIVTSFFGEEMLQRKS